jgi:hypothetical protein
MKNPEINALYESNHGWEIVRSYEEFISMIEGKANKGIYPKFISFDHDLSDEHYAIFDKSNESWNHKIDPELFERTGYHCAKWLLEFCIDKDIEMPIFNVHSMNPVGAKKIHDILMDWYKFKNQEDDGK